VEKVFIKPTSKEILIKDSAKEGYLDIYSYDYNTDHQKRKLGSLYIIGNVSQGATTDIDANGDGVQDEMDIAYMVNLVASLAKREYYAKPDLAAKEAFSATLKKINEIVEEFFKNKGTKVNIGIFAVAGEDILISKLGKFKILLSRDDQVIDVLNNIALFTKEHVDEREFSNIISGKVKSGDKLLAFYPSRFITSREKTIKDHFVKLTWTDFLEKINSARSGRTQAACAALYIDINKAKESVVAPIPQPKELKPKKMPLVSPDAQLISVDSDVQPPSTAIELDKPELPLPTPYGIGTPTDNVGAATVQEIPKIIPSEFSSAKKENIFEKLFSTFRSLMPMRSRSTSLGRIGAVAWHVKLRKRAIYATPALVLIIIGGWVAKSFIFVSAEEKESRKFAKEVQANIDLAQSKLDANDLTGVRELLLSSLLNSTLPSDAKKEMDALLDKADNAAAANPVLVESLPEEITLKIGLFTLFNEDIKDNKYGLSVPTIGFDLYQDNLYILAGDRIFKVIDAAKGVHTSVGWLQDDVTVPTDSVAIAVDGDVYTLSKSGTLTKYFRGAKVATYETSVPSGDVSLLTAKDIPNLYIVNESLGRIYVIDKASGSVIKVLKLGNSQPFTASWVDEKGVLYLGSPDGKVWKVE